jgi:hypothetical protein
VFDHVLEAFPLRQSEERRRNEQRDQHCEQGGSSDEPG